MPDAGNAKKKDRGNRKKRINKVSIRLNAASHVESGDDRFLGKGSALDPSLVFTQTHRFRKKGTDIHR